MLHFHPTADGIHNTGKFRQQAIASILDRTAVVLFDLWIDKIAEMRPEAFVRPLFVGTHQARVPRHIGGEDRGETAGGGHYSSGMPALRYPSTYMSRISGGRVTA